MTASLGVVASGHPETSAAGVAVLEAGGNAFDAALGALCAATVCEPLLTSLGGGGFLLARPAGQAPEVFDFFVQTPATKRTGDALDFSPVMVDFGSAQQEFHVGLGSVAVPGVVAGLFEVHEALGRCPLSVVLEPAIELARRGVEITPYQAYISQILRPILECSPAAMALVAANGAPERPAPAGELVSHPELADTLSMLIEEGRRGFYEGDLAGHLLRDSAERGGMLSRKDLAAYEVIRRQPVHSVSHGADFWFNAPPSPGGTLVAFALGLLDSLELPPVAWGGESHAMPVACAMDAANQLRAQTVNQSLDDQSARRLLSPETLEHWRQQALPANVFSRGTTHLSVADKDGNIASLTSSNGEGCGYVIPGSGVMMNNMLGEEDLNPQGFHQWEPASRLASMMCPTLARLADGSELALGTGGSNRIRSAVLQVLTNLCVFDQDLESAINAPRMHLEGDALDLEAGFQDGALAALDERWPQVRSWPGSSLYFGGVHAVQRYGDGTMKGVGDPRRGGSALEAG